MADALLGRARPGGAEAGGIGKHTCLLQRASYGPDHDDGGEGVWAVGREKEGKSSSPARSMSQRDWMLRRQ